MLAAEDGMYKGFIAVADPIRETSSQFFKDLKEQVSSIQLC